jgi:hypothetical protein
VSMGLGQLPPQSAAPVVMNVAGGLRVEAFLGVEFRGYFADIRVAEVSPSNHGLVAKTHHSTSRELSVTRGQVWPKCGHGRPALWVVRPRLHKLNRRASTVEQRAGERTPDNGGQPGSTVEVGVRR